MFVELKTVFPLCFEVGWFLPASFFCYLSAGCYGPKGHVGDVPWLDFSALLSLAVSCRTKRLVYFRPGLRVLARSCSVYIASCLYMGPLAQAIVYLQALPLSTNSGKKKRMVCIPLITILSYLLQNFTKFILDFSF